MRASRRARSARFAPFFQLSISTLAITAVALSLLVLQFVLRSSPKHRISQSRKSLDSHLSNTAADGVRFGDKVSDTPPGKQDCTVGKTVILSNGVLMPRLGFGTAGLGPETEVAVSWAINAGYRLIDSAQAQEWYREAMVGSAINHTSVPRDRLFLVSKLHPHHHGYQSALDRIQDSLGELNTSYLDLFLLHYPACFPAICPEGTPLPTATWQDSWQALEEMYDRRLIRSIGVSNFGVEEMRSLLAVARVRPHVLQSHSDPLQSNAGLREFCREEGIQFMGYSTLGSQWQFKGKATPGSNPVLSHPVIMRVAATRGCSTAQVVLRWAMCEQQVVIPRSHDRMRIESNWKAMECGLTNFDLDEISRLDGTYQEVA